MILAARASIFALICPIFEPKRKAKASISGNGCVYQDLKWGIQSDARFGSDASKTLQEHYSP
jgi:hypothetical protein